MGVIVEVIDDKGLVEDWWNNFYTYVYNLNTVNEEETLQKELLKANARLGEYNEIEFDAKEDYVMFVLKWT